MSLHGGTSFFVVSCRMCQSCFTAFRAKVKVAALHAKARVAAFRLRPAGAIPDKTGSCNTRVGLRQPYMVRRELLIETSTFFTCFYCGLLLQTGAQYSAAGNTRACVEICSVLAQAPQVVPARRRMSVNLDETFPATSSRCCLKFSIRSRRTPRLVQC